MAHGADLLEDVCVYFSVEKSTARYMKELVR